MENLIIESTESTPEVHFDGQCGKMVLRGESYPENAQKFFAPLLQWVDTFLAQGGMPLLLETTVSYLNTSSIKGMMDLLDRMEHAHRNGHAVSVRWLYDVENDRAYEIALEFKEDLTLPFEIVAVTM